MRTLSIRLPVALLSLALVAAAVVACRGGCGCGCAPAPAAGTYAAPAYTPAPPPTAATPFEAQAARGGALYGKYCASCHGADARGSRGAPPLAGAGALPADPRPGAKVRTGTFRTAGDVGRFVATSMPPVGPKPSADEAWAILAFALKANGVARTGEVGPADADSIVLHP